eukprot:5366497-Pleurochrysis_carterae.AAC.2
MFCGGDDADPQRIDMRRAASQAWHDEIGAQEGGDARPVRRGAQKGEDARTHTRARARHTLTHEHDPARRSAARG